MCIYVQLNHWCTVNINIINQLYINEINFKTRKENYARTRDIKYPGETGCVITLAMLVRLFYDISHEVAQSPFFNRYFILDDNLIKSEWISWQTTMP